MIFVFVPCNNIQELVVNLFFLLLQGKSYLQSLKDDIKPKTASPLATPVDLIDFGGSNPAPGIPLATSYGEVNSAQSNPYFGGQPEATNFAEQSFASCNPGAGKCGAVA